MVVVDTAGTRVAGAFYLFDDGFYLGVGVVNGRTADHSGGGVQITAVAVFVNNTQGFVHLLLVVEVHLYVDAVVADVVQQGAQLGQRHPARHDALAAVEDFTVQVVPLLAAALWLADAGGPLDGVQLVDFQ